MACLEFAKVFEYWTIDDWSKVIFSNELKINKFVQMGYVGVGYVTIRSALCELILRQ